MSSARSSIVRAAVAAAVLSLAVPASGSFAHSGATMPNRPDLPVPSEPTPPYFSLADESDEGFDLVPETSTIELAKKIIRKSCPYMPPCDWR